MGENFGQICTHATTSTFESLHNRVKTYLGELFCLVSRLYNHYFHSQLFYKCITHKFWANFCPKVNLCDDFEEKDVNTKNNWEILEVLFIIGILVRWSFRKYFTKLWYATLPSNGTAAWLMDKTETIQGKSGHEYLVHTLLGFRIIIRQTFLVLIFQKWDA